MTADLLYLTNSRRQFTKWSLDALAHNTCWDLLRDMRIYCDVQPGPLGDHDDGASDLCCSFLPPAVRKTTCEIGRWGGPINVMLHYLKGSPADVMIKIDNDVIVPPGWLERVLDTMEKHPQIDILGIEPPMSRTRAPWANLKIAAPEHHGQGPAKTRSVGGIGAFRTRAFRKHPDMVQHSTYGGFTDWQERHRDLEIAWINPPLNHLFLLDRMPMLPFSLLSEEYRANGWQRPWTPYTDAEATELTLWWLASKL